MPVDELRTKPVAGRYELRQLLGRGGMGTVWRAEDVLLQRQVAVKRVEAPAVMAAEDRAAVSRRVLREARAAARVAHPRLVMLFDVIDEDDVVYLVQELVDAPTLKELVAEQGPRSPSEAARIGIQLVDGLAAAHRAGVVHRDVKPANVMVLEDGGIKLADFGIASLAGDPQLTATGTIIGSPAFMAPEQAMGSDVGPPADLWSVAATLYFAVEGEPPFNKVDTLATLNAVLHDPPRPSVRAGALGPVLERLLAKDPDDRPDGAEVGRLLQTVAASDQQSVPRPSPPPPPTAADRTEELRPAAAVDQPRVVHRQPVVPPDRPRAQPTRPGRRRLSDLSILTALVVLALLGVVAVTALTPGRDRDRPGTLSAEDAKRPSESADQEEPAAPEARTRPTAAPGSGGTTPTEAPTGWKTHKDPDTGYTVSYPGGWRIEERDGTRTDFVDPQTGAYLRVDWTNTPGDSPEGAWRQQSASFGARHANYREIRIDPTTYKGFRAALWEYTYDAGGASLHAYNLGFVTDRHGFALNFQTREPQWAAAQPVWEKLKAGFEVPEGD